MRAPDTNPADAATLALSALAWTLGESRRAERLLALTGLDADALRSRAAEPTLLAAVLGFLGQHEPDLTACAAALDVRPEELSRAQQELET
jgi:hypothetical protein